MYTLTDKLRESGREPICFFQDHIKRIRPVNKRNDIRLDLGEVVNEFKAFATATNIPVITDSHLNRDASKVLDDNSGSNKKDLIRSLGSFNVSESYLMIDNCDLGIIINKENDSHDNLYMGFKCIKTRTKCTLDLFYQPYMMTNEIKLVEDLYSPVPSFKRQLKEDKNTGMKISKRVNRSDDDDLFSLNTISDNMEPGRKVDPGIGAVPVDPSSILYPRNENQSQFVTSGMPSEPVLPMPAMIPDAFANTSPIKNDPWETELISRSIINSGLDKPAIRFLDDDGVSVNNGLLPYEPK